jgi:hypothetical protein
MEAGTRKVTRRSDVKRQIDIRIDIIAQFYRRGYTYRDIRREVMQRLDLQTYSLQTLHKDVHKMLADWREERLENIDEQIQLELSRIDEMIREAWAQWEKSKADYSEHATKRKGVATQNGENGEGSGVKPVLIEQTRKDVVTTGDVRYLELIHKLLCERRKLLGLYPAEKKEISGANGEALIPEAMSREDIENEVKRIMQAIQH